MSDTEEAKVNADVPIPSDTEIRKEMEVLMRTVNLETMSVKVELPCLKSLTVQTYQVRRNLLRQILRQ